MPLYDYRCPEGHVFERRASYAEDVAACSCGAVASRVAVNRIGFSGFATTPAGKQDMREDFRRFREASATLEDQAARATERYQRPVATPPLFKAAQSKAKKLERAGKTADSI